MKKMATIRNIIFDLGGVLVRLKKTDFTRFDRQLKLKHGTVRSIIKACTREATIRKRFNERLFFEKHFSQFLPFTTYAKILSDWFATEKLEFLQNIVFDFPKKIIDFFVYRVNLESKIDVVLESRENQAYAWVTGKECYARDDLIEGVRTTLEKTGYVLKL